MIGQAMARRWCWLLVAAWGAAAWAAPGDGQSTYDVRGTIGPYKIGGQLMVEGDRVLTGAHYFYASRLMDIPLTGAIEGEHVTLREPGGGAFQLQLVSNGSAKGQKLTFRNSVGLEGDWIKGAETLPVKLGFDAVEEGPPSARRYGDVTNEPDQAFEGRVQQFIKSVLNGDKDAAARLVSYPLRVNAQPAFTVHSERELLARWNQIFTPKLEAALRDAIPHEMFVHNGLAMIGDGQVWFNGTGASAINEP